MRVSESMEGEIQVAPKKVHWFLLPHTLTSSFKVQLLKNDLLVTNCRLNDIEPLKKINDKSAVYLFNLDEFFNKLRVSKAISFGEAANSAIRLLVHFIPERTVVHTQVIDPDIVNVFKRNGILLLSRNLGDPRVAQPVLLKLAQAMIYKSGKEKRSNIRINIARQIPIDIQNLSREAPRLKGFINDVSLSGLGAELLYPEQYEYLAVKNFLRIRLFFPGNTIRVDKALLMRKSTDNNELGVYFNIDDTSMISQSDSDYISMLIHEWLEEVINKQGVHTDLNNLKTAT